MSEMDSTPPPLFSPAEFSLISPNSSSSTSSDTEEDVNHGFDPVVNRRYTENSYRIDFPARRDVSTNGLELSVSCLFVVLILWLFAWVTLIAGVYGPQKVWIGPNSAVLVQPNFIFLQSVKVTELDESKSGLELFGFYGSPSDVLVNWSDSRLLSISQKSHKEWPYYLNEGTSLNISYSIKPEGSLVQLGVNEGIWTEGSQFIGVRGVSQWLNEDAYGNTTFSWNQIKGSGVIELKISKSSSYYFSVTNLNMEDVKVELNIDVRAVLYDTREPFYKCTFSKGECTFTAMSLVGNSLVLTSPAPSEGESKEWLIVFSYEPRWLAYILGTIAVICFMLVAIQLCKKVCGSDEERYQTENDSQRTRLLASKDEDGSSMGSSNESFAADDADLEDFVGNEGEASNSTRRLCAICFDSQRDCFFLPCGHCVSCYQCGTKVAETTGSCPICRRRIKKVKRIYTV